MTVAEEPLAHVLRIGMRHLATEETNGELVICLMLLRRKQRSRSFVVIRRPGLSVYPADVREAREHVRVGREISRRQQSLRPQSRCDASTEDRVMFARATSAAGRSSFDTSTQHASISTPFAAALASVATTALSSVSSAITAWKPELRRDDCGRTRNRSRSRQHSRLRSRASARAPPAAAFSILLDPDAP